jgi:hypothetical protein
MPYVQVMLVDLTKREFQVEVKATVNMLIHQIAKGYGTDASNVRLILRGAVRKNPAETISQLQLKPSDILICNVLCPQAKPPEPRQAEAAAAFESKVSQLVELGFDRKESEQALHAQGGNIEAAAGFLM